MSVCDSSDSQSRFMSRNEERDTAAASDSNDATNSGLQRMLDLPTELRWYVLELLIIDKSFVAYYTLLEQPEIGGLVRCNFNAQLRTIRRSRSLASQLEKILITTALLSTRPNDLHSSQQLAEFLSSNLLDENLSVSLGTPTQTAAFLNMYRTCLIGADILTDQFVKIAIGNTLVIAEMPNNQRYGTHTLSDVEHHRILRAFLRLQLYTEIREQYGTRRSFERKLRSLFSIWTTWEFDEVRSLARWIRVECPDLLKHYTRSIHEIFASVDAHFHRDIITCIKIPPNGSRDRNRRSKFAKRRRRGLIHLQHLKKEEPMLVTETGELHSMQAHQLANVMRTYIVIFTLPKDFPSESVYEA